MRKTGIDLPVCLIILQNKIAIGDLPSLPGKTSGQILVDVRPVAQLQNNWNQVDVGRGGANDESAV
jgi:hypothetical protein